MTTDVLLSDLEKYFEKAPVIVIIPNEEKEKLIHHMKQNKQKFAEGGSIDVINQIRGWDYGVLLLNSDEGRGIDTRFKKNAIVLIGVPVTNYHEVQQMMGRTSRNRGVCEVVLYVETEEKPPQVLDQLKR